MAIVMGTNYYLHLGKRSAIHDGKAQMVWAVDVAEEAGHFSAPPEVAVIDEYGREMTVAEFVGMVVDDQHDNSHVGERFS